MDSSEKPILIAISIKSIQSEPYIGPGGQFCKSANINGESSEREVRFQLKTGLLNPEQVHRCELLEQHGFTVVPVPSNWRYGYRTTDGWKDFVIKEAMERIAAIYQVREDIDSMAQYDAELAKAVMTELNKSFPSPRTDAELKYALSPEPSDRALGTTLQGLELEGMITGVALRSNGKLDAMANIRITALGRGHLEEEMKKRSTKATNGAFHRSDASTSILRQLLNEFRERNLTHTDLVGTYEGLAPSELKRKAIADGITEVDFDIAMSDLQNHDLLKTGPMQLVDSPPGLFIIGFRSENAYSYLTVEGYKEASYLNSQPVSVPPTSSLPQSVIHGDQINNYGHAAAIGRHSTGQISFQSVWSEQQLHSLATELELVRSEYRKDAISREDDRQLALLADATDEAERGNGHGVAATLSKVGRKALKIAQEIGTDIAAKALTEMGKPS